MLLKSCMAELFSLRRKDALLRAPGEIRVPAECHHVGEEEAMVHRHKGEVDRLRDGPHLSTTVKKNEFHNEIMCINVVNAEPNE